METNRILGIFVYVFLALSNNVSGFGQPNCDSGRTVIVHLFNWNWDDIAAECERFLGPKGYCGVQLSPPHEHRIYDDGTIRRPWWERYQPVSYKLVSRNGNEQQFKGMIQRCNAVHVKIYADVVFNHMVNSDAGQGKGTAGSYYDAGKQQFDGVPYSALDFNCCHCSICTSSSCSIETYQDANQIRNCRLGILLDLALSKDYVRGKVADYLNTLLDLGVSGFRVDACKHTWPGDLEIIYSKLNKKPFIYNEVIDLGGEAVSASEYTHLGKITEFKFGKELGLVFRRKTALKYLYNFGEAWNMLPSDKALVFIDNHDNQRGHGAGGPEILTFWEPRMYKMATAFALAWPYGFARIMSSYRWPGGRFENDWWGPPHHADWSIKAVPINDDDTCGDDWVCEHRWRQIYNMVGFRNVADGQPVKNWWDNDNNQIAFSRGNKAFIAINNEEWNSIDTWLQTGLPGGHYCDVISGNPTASGCTGEVIQVHDDGKAKINIASSAEDPVIAIHSDAKSGSGRI